MNTVPPLPEYDPRYVAGANRFNAGDYFAAHEVWEDLWREIPDSSRRFYQSLIHAAVAFYHQGNGNAAGSARLRASGRRYGAPFAPVFAGLNVTEFWAAVDAALDDPAAPKPRIVLTPPPHPGPGRDPGGTR